MILWKEVNKKVYLVSDEFNMEKKTNAFDESFGWYGSIAVMSAYFLVSFYPSFAKNFWFQLLNLTGALGIMWISNKKKVNQSVVLNVIWAMIALVSIAKMFL